MLPLSETIPLQAALAARASFAIRVAYSDAELPSYLVKGDPVLGGWDVSVYDVEGTQIGDTLHTPERDAVQLFHYLIDQMKDLLQKCLAPMS